MEKVRIENKNNYLVIVRLMNDTVREFKPHSFFMLDKDNVEFIASTTSMFTDKHLTIVDEKVIEEVGLEESEVHYYDDAELKKKLKSGRFEDYKKFIDEEVTTIPMISRVREMIVNASDLQQQRVKYFNEKYEIGK